jgi:hypothetical protein
MEALLFDICSFIFLGENKLYLFEIIMQIQIYF